MADAPPSTPVAAVTTQAGKPSAPAAASGFVGHAALVSALTLVSRVTGLLRDAALASGLGRGPVADAFIFGFQVPNLFRRLFGEGAFSAAFIPAYTRLVRDDSVLARRFASLCLGLLIVVLGAITLLGEALLAAMVAHFPWTQDTALALRLTMIMLPYMPMICLVAILGAMLQVHGRFGSPAAAPILLNLIMIAAILLATRGELSDDQLRHAVRIVAWSVVAAGAAQVIWQTLAVLRVESFTAQLAGTGPAVRSMLRVFVPVVLGLAVFQINTFFDNVLAMALSPKDGQATLHLLGLSLPRPLEKGSVVALAFAQRLYEFPLGIFGIAIATAIFPALAQAAPAGKAGRPSAASQADEADETDSRHLERFAQVLRHGLRLSVFIGLPASVGLILVRVPLARVVFERQAFTLQDSLAVATILAGYAPAIWAYSMNHVLTRAFYALDDSRTPLNISLGMVGLNLVLNLTLVWPLGASGFAWATAACAILQCALLTRAIRRKRVPAPVDRSVLRSWGQTAVLTIAMAAAVGAMLAVFDSAAMPQVQAALLLLGAVTLGAAVVLGGAWLTGAQELAWLLRRGR